MQDLFVPVAYLPAVTDDALSIALEALYIKGDFQVGGGVGMNYFVMRKDRHCNQHYRLSNALCFLYRALLVPTLVQTTCWEVWSLYLFQT